MADPDWIAVATAHLDRLTPPNRERKRATILALVDARLAGRSEETVWKLPNTCSRSCYHGLGGRHKGGWKHDPIFADVLATVHALARRWNDERTLRALMAAQERLALASPVAVGKVVDRMINSKDESVILRAAFGILDRAGLETASKASSPHQDEAAEWWNAADAEDDDGDAPAGYTPAPDPEPGLDPDGDPDEDATP
jgi:hypothetical protein